jgi:hypothetical protein
VLVPGQNCRGGGALFVLSELLLVSDGHFDHGVDGFSFGALDLTHDFDHYLAAVKSFAYVNHVVSFLHLGYFISEVTKNRTYSSAAGAAAASFAASAM